MTTAPTADESDCPGRFKCHGSASWCPKCGDVDLVCDDPACDAHMRIQERREEVDKLQREFDAIDAEHRSKAKELEVAKRTLRRYETGHPVMVARVRPHSRP